MTYEELSAEAKKMGFTLRPKRRWESYKPCKCGHNRRDHFDKPSAIGYVYGIRCKKCGFTVSGRTETEMKRNWNREVSK